ncbi:MAG TPA: ABC transporter ATP-binding protein [Methylococcus sp.]|nr:ABC transporter ATP-binding protein [Methylococcus sp.]
MSGRARVLDIRDLKVARGGVGVGVLDLAEFFLDEGELVSLIGPNGCGKSSLLLSAMGLIERVSGRIVYRGREVGSALKVLEYRRRIAMVFQEPLLFDTSVFQNVASGLKIRGLPPKIVKSRTMAALERFGLAHLADRQAGKLSGGEARRVSLARAFAIEPDVIFCDEPFANLDTPTRQVLSEDLEKVIRETGVSGVLVTHDPSEALRLSHRIVVMQEGRIVQSGTPAEVTSNPVNEFVASFVGMETLLEAVVQRNVGGYITASVAGREIHAVGDTAKGQKVYCGIRPESVTLAAANPTGETSARNVFPATIVGITSSGPFLKLNLDCGFRLVSYVTPESFAALRLGIGKKIFASFKATSVHLIPRAG